MTPSQPRLAATVLILRQGEGTFEVLLLRRHSRSGFAASNWVFPGGTIDPADPTLSPGRWAGVDPEALGAVLGWDGETALGAAVAAVRETFEESGLLLARHDDGSAVDLGAPAVVAMRHALAERTTRRGGPGAANAAVRGLDWHAWLGEAGIVLDLAALAPWARWVTPEAEPRRYDTAFFLAVAPPGQVAHHDRIETTDSVWLSPAEAIARRADGQLPMIFPTVRTLEALSEHPTVEAAFAACRTVERLDVLAPRAILDDDGRVVDIVLDDPAETRRGTGLGR